MKVLILGGTGDAWQLAAALLNAGCEVVSSLTGRVSDPRMPPGHVRFGGFGGVDGLEQWITANHIDRVVDAMYCVRHPVSAAAPMACARAGVPLTRLGRGG